MTILGAGSLASGTTGAGPRMSLAVCAIAVDAHMRAGEGLWGWWFPAIARGRVAGVPVLPGFAVTTAFTRSRLEGLTSWDRDEALHDEES